MLNSSSYSKSAKLSTSLGEFLCEINNDRNNSSNTCVDRLLNARLSCKCLASSVSFCCKKTLTEWMLLSSLFRTPSQQTEREVRVGNSLEVMWLIDRLQYSLLGFSISYQLLWNPL